MDDQKSQSTEISNSILQHIPRWIIIKNDNSGNIIEFKITFVDPDGEKHVTVNYDEFKKYPHSDPLYDSYDWKELESSIEIAKKMGIDAGKAKAEENAKKTYYGILYKNKHYYDEKKPEDGIIVEKMSVERYKKSKLIVPDSEELLETFLMIFQTPDESGRLWVYDDILDDILENGIDEIRISTPETSYFVSAKVFLTYGKVERKKVYIDIKSSTFEVRPLNYVEGWTEIYAPVI